MIPSVTLQNTEGLVWNLGQKAKQGDRQGREETDFEKDKKICFMMSGKVEN